jgi:hypothetical protein
MGIASPHDWPSFLDHEPDHSALIYPVSRVDLPIDNPDVSDADINP